MLLVRKIPRPQVVTVDSSGDGQESFRQFQVGLFQTEKQHAFVGFRRHRVCDITDERRLPHTRSSCQDDELCGLETGRLLIQIAEAGSDAGDVTRLLHAFINAIERLHHDIADGDLRGPALILHDPKDLPFRRLKQFLDVVSGIVTVGQNLCAGVDQTSLHVLFTDNAGVVANVCRMRDRFQNLRQIGRAANVIQLIPPDQFFRQRDRIDPADTRFIQLVNRCVDLLMRVAVKLVCLERFADLVKRLIHEQNAAEHTAFGVQILRRQAELIGFGFAVGARIAAFAVTRA